MKLALATTAAALLAVGFAAPASAEEVTVPGCVSHAGPTPDFGIYVGDITVPVLTDISVCAFDSATVSVDVDPIEESENCAYGPAVHVMGPAASVDGPGVDVHYTEDGVPSGGTLYEPPFTVDVAIDGYDSGPLWMLPC